MRTLRIRIGERIGGDDPRIPVAVFCDDAGDRWLETPIAETEWAAPSKYLDIDQVIGVVGEEGPSDRFKEYGNDLFQLLMAGEVGQAWQDLYTEYWGPPPLKEGLRTVFDIQDPELQALPWELLAKEDILLFANSENPCVRGTWTTSSDERLSPDPPIRLLVVAAAEDQESTRIERELLELSKSCVGFSGVMEPVILHHPSKADISRAVRDWQPHIFHFAGHGREDHGALFLQLHDPIEGCDTDVPVSDVLNWFVAWAPRVVFLNACRSGQAGASLQRGISGLRTQLLRETGVRAVVAMQGDIQSDAAAELAHTVFECLRERKPLDVAIARGRQAIMDLPNLGSDYRDAYLPVLELRVPPDDVISIPDAQPLASPEYRRLRSFVDRAEERRLLTRLDPLWLSFPSDRDTHVAAVIGDKEIGKTTLIRWALRNFALRGRRFRYVTFAVADSGDNAKANLFAVLSTIAGRRQPWEQRRPLSAKLDELAALDPDGDFGGLEDTEIHALCGKLLDGLDIEPNPDNASFLLAIDGIEGIHSTAFEQLAEYLLTPVAKRQHLTFRIVLGVRSNNRKRLEAIPNVHEVVVKRLKSDLWRPLASQYFAQLNDLPQARWARGVAALEPLMSQEDWGPGKLEDAHRILEK